ncbi:hypothetical protein EYF80_044043 [Liparis tanakae]|uniref:Uncharacterized protein n=1 Tax=Liparis tanakae TaxID=230148 RepID=A0A4Z2FY06_9TELE|nr:hypothetical protein EYF80_044043 [Liparis tanakae]
MTSERLRAALTSFTRDAQQEFRGPFGPKSSCSRKKEPLPTRGLRSPWWFFNFFLKSEMVEGRYRMIHGSEDAALGPQPSEPPPAGTL